ncbi:deoxyhypusine synthase [Rhizoctonia solani AG-1 IA]|uniref:deoxyhypusine synthase n=1 Tax=Thanatephorus cucumeris (strain AG1-IA) TaxID=983506 RepID=L8WYH3_THACA|nr:deoxyhypusine synthase [Rhizoctonia solani AG-1 IA]
MNGVLCSSKSFKLSPPGIMSSQLQPEAPAPPATAAAAVLVQSHPVPDNAMPIKGPDFDSPLDLNALLGGYERIGFQATSLGKAIDIVNKMVGVIQNQIVSLELNYLQRKWRLSDEPLTEDESPDYTSPEVRAATKCTVFLGYTSNLISSGLREVILHLVKHKHLSAIVTTAGGIEEDFIKCLNPTYLGDFHLDGAELRRKGMNRIGNLVVPNDNYCKFEDWVTPILNKMLEEQNATGEVWTPSKVIRRLGKEINHEESVYYWAYKVRCSSTLSHLVSWCSQNDIPVFCPALTDGSLGDMIYFHSFRNPGLTIDIVRDIRALNDISLKARKAGMIILGGGVCKHQIANAMLMPYIPSWQNTGQEFDGSDSGARPDEAISWGKIRAGSESVKVRPRPCAHARYSSTPSKLQVFADATLVFPLLVAATYGRAHWEEKSKHAQ